MDWTIALGMVTTAALLALACLLAITALSLRDEAPPSVFAGQGAGAVFIFDGEALVDATPAARALIDSAVDSGGPWFRAMARLGPLFPRLADRLDDLPATGRFILPSGEGVAPPLLLRGELVGGLVRLTLCDPDGGPGAGPAAGDPAFEAALTGELAALRAMLARAPLPMWRTASDGQVIWANGEYLRLLAAMTAPERELPWPLPPLFGAGGEPAGQGERHRIALPGGDRLFEVFAVAGDDQRQFCAFPADRQARAEAMLDEFKQTLTKTFAQLPIGLAIFDRERALAMFNPALVDLTGLPAEALLARPTLVGFLDAMRERAMIPEPRDYRGWRRRLVEMEEAAASGLFQDTWSLPGGQTYRITGRPHPNGALAFMVEDISTEMTRTRRFRAELEQGRALVDALPEAVAVFAQDGSLVQSNPALRALWAGAERPLPFGDSAGAIGFWRAASAPTLLWDAVAASIGAFGSRDSWSGEARLADGRLIDCRVAPLPHGATMVSFRPVTARALPAPGEGAAGGAVLIA